MLYLDYSKSTCDGEKQQSTLSVCELYIHGTMQRITQISVTKGEEGGGVALHTLQ